MHLTLKRAATSQNVSQSEIRAVKRILPLLRDISTDLERVVNLFHMINSGGIGRSGSSRSTLKTIMETKAPHLEKHVQGLCELVATEMTDRSSRLAQLAIVLKKHLTGRGPAEFSSVDHLVTIGTYLDQMVKHILESPDANRAELQLDYCQNGTLAAAGKVTIVGRACIDSMVYAGESLVVKGSIRGGRAESLVSVTAGELGTAMGAATRIVVPGDGWIKAGVVHPGVRLHFGSWIHNNQETLERVRVHCDGGKIQFSYY